MTVAELKYVLKQFEYPLGGKKSVLQSRVMVVLQLMGPNKVAPIIKQIPRMEKKLDILINLTNCKSTVPPKPKSHLCPVKFKETVFYTIIDTLVEPTPLGMHMSDDVNNNNYYINLYYNNNIYFMFVCQNGRGSCYGLLLTALLLEENVMWLLIQRQI